MKSFSFWSCIATLALAVGLLGCGAANTSAAEQPTSWQLRITEYERNAIDSTGADRLIASIRRTGDRYEWSPSIEEGAWLPVNGSAAEVESQLAAIEAASHSEGEVADGELPITFSYRRGSSELRVSRTRSGLTDGLRGLQNAAVALIAAQHTSTTHDESVDPAMGGFSEGACAPEVHVSSWEENGRHFDLCTESCIREGVRFACISPEERDELDRVIVNSNGVDRERFARILIERVRGRIASGEVVPMLDPSDTQK